MRRATLRHRATPVAPRARATRCAAHVSISVTTRAMWARRAVVTTAHGGSEISVTVPDGRAGSLEAVAGAFGPDRSSRRVACAKQHVVDEPCASDTRRDHGHGARHDVQYRVQSLWLGDRQIVGRDARLAGQHLVPERDECRRHRLWDARSTVRSIASSARGTASARARSASDRYALRLDSASPSGPRTVGTATMSTGMFRSRTMARMSVSCCRSLRPNAARSGWTMWNSLATTVSTPAKCPGRIAPSHRASSASSPGRGPTGVTATTGGDGYMSAADGANTMSTSCAAASAASLSSVRG